jgi:hypothetical protein
VGHACELNQKGLSVAALRAAAQQHSDKLEVAAGRFWELWLDSVV